MCLRGQSGGTEEVGRGRMGDLLEFGFSGIRGFRDSVERHEGENQPVMNFGVPARAPHCSVLELQSLANATGTDQRQPEFALQQKLGGGAASRPFVSFRGAGKLPGVVAGIAREFSDERGTEAKALGLTKAGKSGFVLSKFRESHAEEELSEREASVQFAGTREQATGFLQIREIVHFEDAEFEVCLGITRLFLDFLPAEFAIKGVLTGANLLACGEAEMMDDEIGLAECFAKAQNFGPDAFVHAADEANLGVVTKEANILVLDVSRILGGSGESAVVRESGAIPDAVVEAEHVIADGDLIGIGLLTREDRKSVLGCRGIQP